VLLVKRNLLDHQYRYFVIHTDMRLKLAVRHPGADPGAGALRKDILATEVVVQLDANCIRVMN